MRETSSTPVASLISHVPCERKVSKNSGVSGCAEFSSSSYLCSAVKAEARAPSASHQLGVSHPHGSSSLHSPLPSLRGVELKFLKVDTAGVKTTRGATRGSMAVLGIARRALANRRDISAGMWCVKCSDEISGRDFRYKVKSRGQWPRSNFSVMSSTTITHLAYSWAEGGSRGYQSTNEGGFYQSESMGAGQEADGNQRTISNSNSKLRPGPPPCRP